MSSSRAGTKAKASKKPLKKVCVGCGDVHDAGVGGTFVMPARLESKDTVTRYACGQECYEDWRWSKEGAWWYV